MKIVLALRQAQARLVLELVLSDEPGVTVVGTASEAEGLLALARTAQPDLVLVDWDLPGRPMPEVLLVARSLPRPIRVLVLGHNPQQHQPALHAGARAFVLVGDPPEVLLAAVRQERATLRH